MKYAYLYGLIALVVAICAGVAFPVTGSFVWGAVGLAAVLLFAFCSYEVTQRRQSR